MMAKLRELVAADPDVVETTAVSFKPLTLDQALAYVVSINPLDKAGGYAIQEKSGLIVEKSGRRCSTSFPNLHRADRPNGSRP